MCLALCQMPGIKRWIRPRPSHFSVLSGKQMRKQVGRMQCGEPREKCPPTAAGGSGKSTGRAKFWSVSRKSSGRGGKGIPGNRKSMSRGSEAWTFSDWDIGWLKLCYTLGNRLCSSPYQWEETPTVTLRSLVGFPGPPVLLALLFLRGEVSKFGHCS